MNDTDLNDTDLTGTDLTDTDLTDTDLTGIADPTVTDLNDNVGFSNAL